MIFLFFSVAQSAIINPAGNVWFKNPISNTAITSAANDYVKANVVISWLTKEAICATSRIFSALSSVQIRHYIP